MTSVRVSTSPPSCALATAARSSAKIAGNAAGAAQIKTPDHRGVAYVLELSNGRDIELISDVTQENEVVTLPGATFKVTRIEAQGAVPGTGIVYAFCRQVK